MEEISARLNHSERPTPGEVRLGSHKDKEVIQSRLAMV